MLTWLFEIVFNIWCDVCCSSLCWNTYRKPPVNRKCWFPLCHMCRCQSQPGSTAWSDRTASGPWSRSDSSSPASAPSRSDSRKQRYSSWVQNLLPSNLAFFYYEPKHRQNQWEHLLACFTLNHLASMFCLENSHSRVAGNSSSTRTSPSVLRIDTGVSVNSANPTNEPMNQQINHLMNQSLIWFYFSVYTPKTKKNNFQIPESKMKSMALQRY